MSLLLLPAREQEEPGSYGRARPNAMELCNAQTPYRQLRNGEDIAEGAAAAAAFANLRAGEDLAEGSIFAESRKEAIFSRWGALNSACFICRRQGCSSQRRFYPSPLSMENAKGAEAKSEMAQQGA